MVTMPADTTERYFSMSPFAGINEDLNDDRLAQQGEHSGPGIMMGAVGGLLPHGLCASARDVR